MTLKERFDRKWIPEPFSGCWLWTGANYPYGYGVIKDQKKSVAAHRISWILHHGDIPNGLCVLHKCDTPACVNPNHLFLGNKKDNMEDCLRKGRFPERSGENNGRCRLSAENVTEIRRSNARTCDLARQFGVNWCTIRDVRNQRNWRYA